MLPSEINFISVNK